MFFLHIPFPPISCIGISTQLATLVCINTCAESELGTLPITSFRSSLKVTGATICAKLTVENKIKNIGLNPDDFEL